MGNLERRQRELPSKPVDSERTPWSRGGGTQHHEGPGGLWEGPHGVPAEEHRLLELVGASTPP